MILWVRITEYLPFCSHYNKRLHSCQPHFLGRVRPILGDYTEGVLFVRCNPSNGVRTLLRRDWVSVVRKRLSVGIFLLMGGDSGPTRICCRCGNPRFNESTPVTGGKVAFPQSKIRPYPPWRHNLLRSTFWRLDCPATLFYTDTPPQIGRIAVVEKYNPQGDR